MRQHHWQWGMIVLCALVVFPFGTRAADDLERLTWFDLEKGEICKDENGLAGIPFTPPTDCDGTLKCTIEEKKLKEDCREIEEKGDVTKEGEKFVIGASKTEEVLCFDAEEKPYLTGSPSDAARCTLRSTANVARTLDGLFVELADGAKAVPWNEAGEIACPDPLLTVNAKAYELEYDDALKAYVGTVSSPKVARRTVLDACSKVLTSYLSVCKKELAEAEDAMKTLENDRAKETLALQMEKAKLWTGANDCSKVDKKEWWENTNSMCYLYWNTIKDLTYKDAHNEAYLSALVAKEPITEETKTAIETQYSLQENKEWAGTMTLGDFLRQKADKKYYNSTYEPKYTSAREVKEGLEPRVNFLAARLKSITLGNALSETKTLNVSKWLTRNTTSKEAKLSAFDASDPNNIFNKIILLITQVLGALGVLLLIISGVMMVVSRGEETMLQKSKQTFTYTLIGLVIGFLSYTIVRFILELLLIR